MRMQRWLPLLRRSRRREWQRREEGNCCDFGGVGAMTKTYDLLDFMFPEEELRETFPTQNHDNYLYHYTNLDAALSILKNKEIWLSEAASLNDTSEGILLYKKLIEISGNKQVRDNIIETHTLLTKNTYIGSLSKFGNLLTLWRGYGNISIGFDFWELRSSNIIEDENGDDFVTSALAISSCDYLNKSQIEKLAEDLIGKYEESIRHDVYRLLSLGSIYFDIKHPAFLDEREARIVCYLYDRKPFTNAKGKKYIKFKFDTKAIKRIVFGPSASEDTIEKVSQQISTNINLNHIKIYKSTIPFTGK